MGLGLTPPWPWHFTKISLPGQTRLIVFAYVLLVDTTKYIFMQISRNMVNWPKSNNWVLVGIWLSSASRNHLATFCKPLVHFACLRLFSAIVHFIQGFLRRFRGPIRVPRIRENYHRVPKIRENRVPRIREIGSLQTHTGYLTFSLKKTCFIRNDCLYFVCYGWPAHAMTALATLPISVAW